MGGLRIWLCGGLRVELDGARVEDRLTRRKSRELLAFLVDRRSPMRRDELVEFLWPGEPAGVRDAALRQLLSELRGCLGAAAIVGRDPVGLSLPEDSWVDVLAAQASLAAARDAFVEQHWSESVELAGGALEVPTATFMAGHDSDWVAERARDLERERGEALEVLAAACLNLPGREADAEDASRQLVGLAPLREAGYSLLMRAQVARGNSAEALQTYDRLRKLVREELGTTPSVKMSALHRWVLAAGSSDEAEPATGYARRGDGVRIAYQVMGDAGVDLVITPGFMSHLDLQWADPSYRAFLRRLTAFTRVITLDKAGTGTSDPIEGELSLQEWAKDLEPVLDAVGSRSAVLFGASEAGPVTIEFAQSHPERVDGLILYGALAKVAPEPGYLWEHREEIFAAFARFGEVELAWGEGGMTELMTPAMTDNDAQRRAWAVFERSTGSPTSMARRTQAVLGMDVRDLLPRLDLPTLVLHREGDRMVLPWYGRFLADAIPGARYAELPGSCHPPYLGETSEVDTVVNAIETFMAEISGRFARPVGT